MNFKELVEERRSVRRYSDREVEQSKLDYILEWHVWRRRP